MKTTIRFVLFHTLCFIGATALFIILSRTAVFSHMVFFYRGVVLLVITTIFMIGLLVGWKRWGNTSLYTIRDIALATVVFFCINLVVFTHLPVTADRSMSVFLLGYMNRDANRTYTTAELQRAFTTIYLNEHHALEKRFNEQYQSGTITRDGEKLKLTRRGTAIVRLYSWIADLFGMDKKNLSL